MQRRGVDFGSDPVIEWKGYRHTTSEWSRILRASEKMGIETDAMLNEFIEKHHERNAPEDFWTADDAAGEFTIRKKE
jgi:hypothetical protein